MVVNALVSFEVSTRASTRPSKAPSSFAPGLLGFCRKKSGHSQKSALSSNTFRLSTFILAHKGSTLSWLVDGRATPHLQRIWFLLTQQYVQHHAYACNDTLSGVSRQYHLPLACHALPKDHRQIGRSGEAHLAKCPDTTKLPPLAGWAASWCHLSSVKYGFVQPSERTPLAGGNPF